MSKNSNTKTPAPKLDAEAKKTDEMISPAEVTKPAEVMPAERTTPNAEDATVVVEPKVDSFTVSVPSSKIDAATMAKLEALIASKKTLLKKALGTESLKLEQEDDKILFPWFKLHGIVGEAEAYAELVSAMIKMAKDATRIDSTEKPTDNEKFAMRMFTVRLELKGDKYKLLRKLLTQNLSGNSAWRSGTPPTKPSKQDGVKTSSSIAADTSDSNTEKGGSTL